MRYKELLTEQQLDELRMSPSSLRAFADSPEAKGIVAGFEAELVFTGLGGEDDDNYDLEPDMDADERCYSIQQVMDFFENDEYGYGIYGRDAEKLQEGLDEMYWEWHEGAMYDAFRDEAEDLIKKVIEEDDFDWGDETRKQLDMMGLSDDEIEEAMEAGNKAPRFTKLSDQDTYAQENPGYQRYLEAREQAEGLLNDLVQDSLSSQDKNYDAALDEFRDSFYMDDDSGFFSDVGLRWMSDVQDQFNLMWPVMTGTGSSEGGFNEYNAERLADDLHEKLGVKTKVSSGYHSAKRDNETWIFEPDSSLDADDSDNMPVEIVSPPMPLEECLRQIENFFAWAEDNGAYANSSTGFHMGVSLPYRGGDVDYVKLALFLGDEYVLKEFGRLGNHFTEAAIKKIRQRVKGNKEAVSGALELMKNNLLELAQKALEINNHGFGKYTSINPQGGVDSTKSWQERGAKYIEFRSAGGSNYFEDIDKLKNTLLRYAKAMSVAASPSAERKEYYKKLYKLISPPEGDPAIDLFSRFATGAISSEELKKAWAEKALEKDAPELTQKGEWVVINTATGKPVEGQSYNGYTKQEVYDKAKQKLSPASSETDFKQSYEIMPQNTGKWEIYSFDPNNDDNEETLEIVDALNRGAAADEVFDKYNDQRIAFKVRPYYGDQPVAPEPKLTRRAELAKRIKAPKPTWNVVYRPTGRVIDQIINVSREEAQKLLVKVAQQHQFDSIDDLELHNEIDAPAPNKGNWEIYRTETGNVIDTIRNVTQARAEVLRQDIIDRYGHPTTSVGLRPMEPAEPAPNVAQNFSTNPNPTIQQPGQVRAPNGVPMWEVYQRDNGHVVHTFADHTQREAWAAAQAWLRSIGAEPSAFSEFSVRPKMNNTNESAIAGRVFADFDAYFESVVAPAKKKLK